MEYKAKTSSKYFGVIFNVKNNNFNVYIMVKGKNHNLGVYKTDIEAAKAYDNFIIENKMTRRMNFPTEPELPAGTKAIHLDKGLFSVVDESDFEELNKYRWMAFKGRNTWYATRTLKVGKSKSTIFMHCAIMNRIHIDHINGNGLFNTKSNLRTFESAENSYNRSANKNCNSEFKGVSITKSNKYMARITYNKKTINIGTFSNEIDAAIAYDVKAKELFGKFAWLNFPELV